MCEVQWSTFFLQLFCCHGGIPPPWLCPAISAINDIPVPLNQPDTQSSLAWELMWNDPVRYKNHKIYNTANEFVAILILIFLDRKL